MTLDEHRIAIIGANGSGKSSLVRLINGLLVAQKGEVRVGTLNPAKEGNKVRQKVGFLFQNPEHQIILPMVREDIALALKNQGIKHAQRVEKVDALMQEMGIAHLSDCSSHMLSGGEKQLVALAGILVSKPDILIMDEPSTLLDLRHLNRFKKQFNQLAQQVVIATHDMSLAAMCQRVIVLEEGKVTYDAPAHQAIAYYEEKMSD